MKWYNFLSRQKDEIKTTQKHTVKYLKRECQNTPVVFVVNSMVMAIFLGAGYLNWRADSLVFGHFKGHN